MDASPIFTPSRPSLSSSLSLNNPLPFQGRRRSSALSATGPGSQLQPHTHSADGDHSLRRGSTPGVGEPTGLQQPRQQHHTPRSSFDAGRLAQSGPIPASLAAAACRVVTPPRRHRSPLPPGGAAPSAASSITTATTATTTTSNRRGSRLSARRPSFMPMPAPPLHDDAEGEERALAALALAEQLAPPPLAAAVLAAADAAAQRKEGGRGGGGGGGGGGRGRRSGYDAKGERPLQRANSRRRRRGRDGELLSKYNFPSGERSDSDGDAASHSGSDAGGGGGSSDSSADDGGTLAFEITKVDSPDDIVLLSPTHSQPLYMTRTLASSADVRVPTCVRAVPSSAFQRPPMRSSSIDPFGGMAAAARVSAMFARNRLRVAKPLPRVPSSLEEDEEGRLCVAPKGVADSHGSGGGNGDGRPSAISSRGTRSSEAATAAKDDDDDFASGAGRLRRRSSLVPRTPLGELPDPPHGAAAGGGGGGGVGGRLTLRIPEGGGGGRSNSITSSTSGGVGSTLVSPTLGPCPWPDGQLPPLSPSVDFGTAASNSFGDFLMASVMLLPAALTDSKRERHSSNNANPHRSHSNKSDNDNRTTSLRPHAAPHSAERRNNDAADDGMEEESMEAAPVRSRNHLDGKRPVYYFEQKQILDSRAGTLEAAAPAMVSGAVRACQSPFAPWCSHHQAMLERAHPGYAQELATLLQDAVATPADVGGVVAAPVGYNAAWRSTGVMVHPATHNLVINPAVVVPHSVLTRPDAAAKMDAFKAVMIRGIPKFERGVQTTLTSYHETNIWFTVCRNVVLQREQVARMSLASERASFIVHLAGLAQHDRERTAFNTDVMAKHPTNVMARYHGGVREMKGQRLMLQRMLQLPTVNGQFLSTVLEPDQVAVFDKALALADALAAKTIECRVPLLQLVRMEAMVREQETRCYVAWVGSAQHLAALIRMSFVRRTSVAVRHSLRTSTEMDGTIRTVQRMLQESAAAGDGACAVVAAASASAGSLTDVTR